jgi:hypothetical protein
MFPAEMRAAAGLAALGTLMPAGWTPSKNGAFEAVELGTDTVTIRHRRTGRLWRYPVTVRGRAASDLEVEIRAESRGTAQLTLVDLPEPDRETLRQMAQASLLPAVLDQAARDAVAAGVLPYAEALEHAMLRHLDGEAEAADLDALAAALDLLALDRRPVPFNVQTSFYRLYTAGSAAGRARLAPLLRRFGFSDTLAGTGD